MVPIHDGLLMAKASHACSAFSHRVFLKCVPRRQLSCAPVAARSQRLDPANVRAWGIFHRYNARGGGTPLCARL